MHWPHRISLLFRPALLIALPWLLAGCAQTSGMGYYCYDGMTPYLQKCDLEFFQENC